MGPGTQLTCFTSTKVHILTRLRRQAVKNLLDYFLLLHDYLGPTGLIHSMRELVCSHIHRMRPTRGGGGGTAGQKDGADAGGGGELGNEGAIDSFRALMQLASESLRDLEARLDGIEAEYLDAQVCV